MASRLIDMDVEAAKEDLRTRTLGPIGYDFGRLLYLASLRDCASGEYHHHGLARMFSEPAARKALATCHKEIFYNFANCPLKLLVQQVERFIRSAHRDLRETVNSWETLEVYRLALPNGCEQLTVELFLSNVKVAIALLKSPSPAQPMKPQSSWPRLSPAQ